MKKVIEVITQIVALAVVLIGVAYSLIALIEQFPVIKEILDSQFFVALITLFVGSVAYLIYLKQKNDFRKDAANLILQEIRYAEQKIREVREKNDNKFHLADKLLPTNNWNKNIHLFISELEENQIDIISKFYSRVTFIDHLIRGIADNRAFPQPLQANQVSQSGNAEGILREVSKQIEFIYNTPAVDLLRKISKGQSI